MPNLASGIAAAMLTGLWAMPAGAFELPCPVPVRWDLLHQVVLPRTGLDGEAIGGFSAAVFDPTSAELWLLSDLPRGSVTVWGGLADSLNGGSGPWLQRSLPLQRDPMDGEGLVRLNDQLWVASEGRRSGDRPASLLQFDGSTGRLLQSLDLPLAWQASDGAGLVANGGPESLTAWRQPDGATVLLMAAEQPLMQDPRGHVRLLRWQWSAGQAGEQGTPTAADHGALLLPRGTQWGLTDLLVLEPSGQLLALWRQFQFPDQWQIRLVLYPKADPLQSRPAAPLAQWDLLSTGLVPDNWEALTAGPSLPDGSPVLVMVSDDNLSPLQANRLAMLVPRCR